MLYNRGLRCTLECDYGSKKQTTQHIVEKCPKRPLNGDTENVHMATPDKTDWVSDLDI